MIFTTIGQQTPYTKKIRIVTATKKPIEEFGQTLLGKSFLNSVVDNYSVDVCVEPNNSSSLASVYNTAIEMSTENPAILVFVHDDVLICDMFWTQTLVNSLSSFQVVGLAGSTRRFPKQAGWVMHNLEHMLDRRYLCGAHMTGSEFPPREFGNYGAHYQLCTQLDGLFLAADSRTLIDNNIRFDPQFSFHFYDMDFCRQCEDKNITMTTAPISVMHNSGGKYDEEWHSCYEKYLRKWNEY